MVDLLKEVSGCDIDDLDLSRFCSVASSSRLDLEELTEAQLQEIEERADRWYLSMM